MSIKIEGREPEEDVVLDMFGFPIEVGDKMVAASNRQADRLMIEEVGKITEKTIFLFKGERTWGRRRIPKSMSTTELINKTKLEKYLEEHETDSDERLTSFRKNNMGS